MTFKIKMGIAFMLVGTISASLPALKIDALLLRQIKVEAWNPMELLLSPVATMKEISV